MSRGWCRFARPVALLALAVATGRPVPAQPWASQNRPDVSGREAAVVSDHPLATAAGFEVLRRGTLRLSAPCVCRHATIPMARSRSPVSVRMAALTVRAATRAISPSRRRR